MQLFYVAPKSQGMFGSLLQSTTPQVHGRHNIAATVWLKTIIRQPQLSPFYYHHRCKRTLDQFGLAVRFPPYRPEFEPLRGRFVGRRRHTLFVR